MYNPHNLRADSFNCMTLRLVSHQPCEADIFALLQKCFDCPYRLYCQKLPDGAYPKEVIQKFGTPDENYGYCPRAFQVLTDENNELSDLLGAEDLPQIRSLF